MTINDFVCVFPDIHLCVKTVKKDQNVCTDSSDLRTDGKHAIKILE